MKKPFKAYRGSEPYTFVCYAHADAETVYSEISWIREDGFHIWYDEGIEAGLSWRDEVASAIMQSSLFLIFVSPNSVRSSPASLCSTLLSPTPDSELPAKWTDLSGKQLRAPSGKLRVRAPTGLPTVRDHPRRGRRGPQTCSHSFTGE